MRRHRSADRACRADSRSGDAADPNQVERALAPEPPVVFDMRADPNPKNTVIDGDAYDAVVPAGARGPVQAGALEMQ